MNIELKGIDKAIKNFGKYAKNIDANRIVTEGAIIVQRYAKDLAPVDTGRLKASVHTSSGAGSSTSATASVSTNVEYASYQEFGTRRMRAQPYMRPAMQIAEPKVRKHANMLIVQGIRKP